MKPRRRDSAHQLCPRMTGAIDPLMPTPTPTTPLLLSCSLSPPPRRGMRTRAAQGLVRESGGRVLSCRVMCAVVSCVLCPVSCVLSCRVAVRRRSLATTLARGHPRRGPRGYTECGSWLWPGGAPLYLRRRAVRAYLQHAPGLVSACACGILHVLLLSRVRCGCGAVARIWQLALRACAWRAWVSVLDALSWGARDSGREREASREQAPAPECTSGSGPAASTSADLGGHKLDI